MKIQKRPSARIIRAEGLNTVEMRGIEPRSDVASTGLLRAQFVKAVFSATLLAQTLTRPNLAV